VGKGLAPDLDYGPEEAASTAKDDSASSTSAATIDRFSTANFQNSSRRATILGKADDRDRKSAGATLNLICAR
jgi:hypothetical protein